METSSGLVKSVRTETSFEMIKVFRDWRIRSTSVSSMTFSRAVADVNDLVQVLDDGVQ